MVDPEWAQIIKIHFFDAFEDLGSVEAVQRHLRQAGILTPSRVSRSGKTQGGKRLAKQQIVRISLGSNDVDRKLVVKEAVREVEEAGRKLGSEAELLRHRLTRVQTEIGNLIGVLKQIGEGGLSSVQVELTRLEEERRQHRVRLRALEEETASLQGTVFVSNL